MGERKKIMKPTILQSYEKYIKVIESSTLKSLGSARRYISLFNRMFVYNSHNYKTYKDREKYRKDLLQRFELKFEELIKNKKNNDNTRNCIDVYYYISCNRYSSKLS